MEINSIISRHRTGKVVMSSSSIPPLQDPNSQGFSQWQAPQSSSVPAPQDQSQYSQAQYEQAQYGQASYGQPQHGQPTYGQPGATYGPSAYAEYYMAPKPGIIALRPLNIGDLLQGSIAALRANPSVMFGFTMAVMSVSALISGVSAAFLTFAPEEMPITEGGVPNEVLFSFAQSISGAIVSSLGTYLVLFLATNLLTGVLALTVSDAVIGRKTNLSSAWQRLRPRFGSLLGFSLLYGILSAIYFAAFSALIVWIAYLIYQQTSELPLPLFVAFLLFLIAFLPLFYVALRLLYAPTIITLEHQGIATSIRRSWTLTSGVFWVTLGRYLTITVVTSLVSGVLSGFIGVFLGIVMLFLPLSLAQGLAEFTTVLLSGVIMPVASAFVTLMYIDRRIRTEGLADALLRASES